jgi:antitoxin (DNA-binding transcriptional repressor) of toxin-antitoxin stability system
MRKIVQVNMHKAKTQLSALAKKAHSGERIVIAKDGKPYLELVPYRAKASRRVPGGLKGKIWMAPDFDQTPEEIVQSFESGGA